MYADWRDVTLGQADGQDVKLSYDKRTQGIAVIGKTGTGKSSLVHAIINQELQGRDCTVILFDPHGELTDTLLHTAATQSKSLFIVTPDPTQPFGLNLLETNPQDIPAVERTVDVTIQIFKKLLGSDYTFMPRFEYIMGNAARTLIYANTGYTLAEIPLILTDEQFRKNVIRSSTNPQIVQFWKEYEIIAKREYERIQYIESAANRLNTLLANDLLYRIVSQSHSTIRFPELLESGKIIVISIPMGKLGEGATSLLGSVLLAKCAETLYSRGTRKKRVHLYIDEYGRYFATPFTADLLTQGRKYNVSTLVTMQTLQQLPDEQNTAAVLNAGNLLCFQLIGKDAEILGKQFPLPGPLPEQVNPLTPYTISPTPVEDVWKKGHPSMAITRLRDNLFILLHRLESEPYEKVFQSPELQSEEGLRMQAVFKDMEDYCSSREQITQGFNKLNELLVMSEEGQAETSNAQMLLFGVLLLFRGFMGFYPQNRKDTSGEYAEWVESRVKRGVMDPRQLTKGFEWLSIKMPGYEAEELYDVFLGIKVTTDQFGTAVKTYVPDRGEEMLHKFPTVYQLFKTQYHYLSEYERREECGKRITFEITNFAKWIKILTLAMEALQTSPVMAQASTYAGGRTWERSQADMRDELVMRLASLPSYTAICQLLYDDGSTQSCILRTLKG